jgi:hypothetical protein
MSGDPAGVATLDPGGKPGCLELETVATGDAGVSRKRHHNSGLLAAAGRPADKFERPATAIRYDFATARWAAANYTVRRAFAALGGEAGKPRLKLCL